MPESARLVAVGSLNPVKIQAVAQAFAIVWPENLWRVNGYAAVSGVRPQPLSDEESICGARQRARQAMVALEADFGVGLEGGLQQIAGVWFDRGWVVVSDPQGREGLGATLSMAVPPMLMRRIFAGEELGDAVDAVFQQINSKQQGGYFGLMTGGKVDRMVSFVHGVIAALARFMRAELWHSEGGASSLTDVTLNLADES